MGELDTCLQCGQTREETRRNDTICGIEGGYEYIELEAEWPRHHWRDWSNRALKQAGIRPESYGKYRRASIHNLEYAACEDTIRGHTPTKESDREYFLTKIGQCIACGKYPSEES